MKFHAGMAVAALSAACAVSASRSLVSPPPRLVSLRRFLLELCGVSVILPTDPPPLGVALPPRPDDVNIGVRGVSLPLPFALPLVDAAPASTSSAAADDAAATTDARRSKRDDASSPTLDHLSRRTP